MRENFGIRFGKLVREKRNLKSITQGQLAGRTIGGDKSRISDIENGKVAKPHPGTIRALVEELDIASFELEECYGPIKGRYHTYNLASAKDRCGSYSDLQQALDQIEDEFPVPTVPGEYGTHEKWIEFLELCADSGGVVARRSNDEIVGHWQCFPVTDAVYEEILRGENVNKSISSEDIRILMQPGKYRLFFISLFLSDMHRNHSVRSLLLQAFFDFLRDAATDGIFFDRIAANITGVEARQICENMHFKKVIDHPIHKYPEHVGLNKPAEVYEMNMCEGGTKFLASDQALHKAYSDAGLFDG